MEGSSAIVWVGSDIIGRRPQGMVDYRSGEGNVATETETKGCVLKTEEGATSQGVRYLKKYLRIQRPPETGETDSALEPPEHGRAHACRFKLLTLLQFVARKRRPQLPGLPQPPHPISYIWLQGHLLWCYRFLPASQRRGTLVYVK